MNARAAACISLFLIVLCVAPAAAANDERYGYITLESVQIQLHNDTAIIDMHYSVDEGTRFIFFLLGKQDLKNKLITILNYDDAQMQFVNLSDAEFEIDQVAYSVRERCILVPDTSVQRRYPETDCGIPAGRTEFYQYKPVPWRYRVF